MVRPFAALLLVPATLLAAQKPKYDCGFGGEANQKHTESLLRAAPTCAQAADIYKECRWGSSIDGFFGSIVLDRCNVELKPKLTPELTRRLQWQRSLCSAEYARQDGTLALSEAASCNVEATADFVAGGPLSRQPVQRASFDCARARTAAEKIICSDPALGTDDILLARAYQTWAHSLSAADKPKLIASQRQWLAATYAHCKPDTASKASIACLSKADEVRIDQLDGCGEAMDVGCLAPSGSSAR